MADDICHEYWKVGRNSLGAKKRSYITDQCPALVYGAWSNYKHLVQWFFVCCLVTKSCPTLFRPHGLLPTRLLCPWDFPGKSTGVGCYFLFQRLFSIQGSNPRPWHWQADSLPLSHQGNSAQWSFSIYLRIQKIRLARKSGAICSGLYMTFICNGLYMTVWNLYILDWFPLPRLNIGTHVPSHSFITIKPVTKPCFS